MADINKDVREYFVSYYDDNRVYISVYSTYENQKRFSRIPTRAELEVLFNASGFKIYISGCFKDCAHMTAAPKLPEDIYSGSSSNGLYETFLNCTALKIPPKLPPAEYAWHTFDGCSALKQAPVIPHGAKSYHWFMKNCTSLAAPVSIPASLKYIDNFYEGCTALAGEFIVRSVPVTPEDILKNTIGEIILYGDRSVCEAVAATANNGNASWQPWYDPEPAVTDRGRGSYTTAADMTRMVRNGALAVNTYAPGRMVYQVGDIVRQDEWNALVAAAQTIDPTVTDSTVYTNLNKIEAAFDSAL